MSTCAVMGCRGNTTVSQKTGHHTKMCQYHLELGRQRTKVSTLRRQEKFKHIQEKARAYDKLVVEHAHLRQAYSTLQAQQNKKSLGVKLK